MCILVFSFGDGLSISLAGTLAAKGKVAPAKGDGQGAMTESFCLQKVSGSVHYTP
ncbi:hypothetical protein ACFH4J_003389 [Escherichia coli]